MFARISQQQRTLIEEIQMLHQNLGEEPTYSYAATKPSFPQRGCTMQQISLPQIKVLLEINRWNATCSIECFGKKICG